MIDKRLDLTQQIMDHMTEIYLYPPDALTLSFNHTKPSTWHRAVNFHHGGIVLVFIQISPKHSLPLFSFQPHLGLAILVPLVFVGVRVPHGSSLLACSPGRCKAQRLLNVLPGERAG